jgi:hypothetical protein
VEAGANAAITQYFFNADAYFNFVDECAALGITLPIVPGIMPITNFSQLARFSDACGAEIPRWLRLKLQGYGDDIESIRSFGLDVVTGICEELLRHGAPGLHFYTLNQAGRFRHLATPGALKIKRLRRSLFTDGFAVSAVGTTFLGAGKNLLHANWIGVDQDGRADVGETSCMETDGWAANAFAGQDYQHHQMAGSSS